MKFNARATELVMQNKMLRISLINPVIPEAKGNRRKKDKRNINNSKCDQIKTKSGKKNKHQVRKTNAGK